MEKQIDGFLERYETFLAEFGKGRKMVLSTAEDQVVSSRMMSIVRLSGVFYFQTDRTFRKYQQLLRNHNVALCIDNIQIEGICEEIGHPLRSAAFCETFRECFKSAYEAYTLLDNERLFAVRPMRIERWVYQDGLPYLESFDMITRTYQFSRYMGM